MAMNANSARFLLQSAGRNFKGAQDHYKKMRSELHRDVILARRNGLTITEISKAAGIPRPTVYSILDLDAQEND